MWPSIGVMPVNEFTTQGYFSCAFPTLFPSGACDFLGRQISVTIGNYFRHLMMCRPIYSPQAEEWNTLYCIVMSLLIKILVTLACFAAVSASALTSDPRNKSVYFRIRESAVVSVAVHRKQSRKSSSVAH